MDKLYVDTRHNFVFPFSTIVSKIAKVPKDGSMYKQCAKGPFCFYD